MLTVAVGLGMFFNLVLMELTGLAAGGIVVPGYVAMTIHRPLQVVTTVLVGLCTYLIVKFVSKYMLLYGRRLLILCILIGYIIGYGTRGFPTLTFNNLNVDLATIGFVVPGLLAYWMHRQGVVETISAMVVTSILVRLVISLISGGVILP